jgi:hypothetical protein
MKRGDDNDRRAYVRLPGAGITATLHGPGLADAQASVRDISCGGVALVCGSTASPGTEVKVGLPIGVSVSGRVVRSEDTVVMIAFRQDEATLSLIDRVLDMIGSRSRPAAA